MVRAVIYYMFASVGDGKTATATATYDSVRGQKDPGQESATSALLTALVAAGHVVESYKVDREEIQ